MRTSVIHCPICDTPCGKHYPAYPQTFDSGGEPPFDEGIGENFTYQGIWHCSEECKQEAIKKAAKE